MTKPFLILIFSASALFADPPPVITQFDYLQTFPQLNVDLRSKIPEPNFESIDGVALSVTGPIVGSGLGWNPGSGVYSTTGILNINFTLGLGAREIAFTDLDVGGGNVNVFYTEGNSQKEVTVDQGPYVSYAVGGFTSTLIQFADAINSMTIKGGTSVIGLKTVPVIPEPSNIWTVSILGLLLGTAGFLSWRKAQKI